MGKSSEDRLFGVFDKKEQRTHKVKGVKALAELLGVDESRIPEARLIKFSLDDRYQIYESH